MIVASFAVVQLREAVAEKFAVPIAGVCLIFSGKILKDADSLAKHGTRRDIVEILINRAFVSTRQGIKDGMAIHLVIKSQPKVQN